MPTTGSNPRGSNAVRSSVARAKGKLNDEMIEPAATNSTPDRAAVLIQIDTETADSTIFVSEDARFSLTAFSQVHHT